MSRKSTPSDSFDDLHKAVLDGKSDNMASLVESGKYEAKKTMDTTTNGFYAFMLTSEVYTPHDNTTTDGKIRTAGDLVVKAQYLCFMQVDTNWN